MVEGKISGVNVAQKAVSGNTSSSGAIVQLSTPPKRVLLQIDPCRDIPSIYPENPLIQRRLDCHGPFTHLIKIDPQDEELVKKG